MSSDFDSIGIGEPEDLTTILNNADYRANKIEFSQHCDILSGPAHEIYIRFG